MWTSVRARVGRLGTGRPAGAVMAVVVGVTLVFIQWWGQPAWSWAVLRLRVGVPSNG